MVARHERRALGRRGQRADKGLRVAALAATVAGPILFAAVGHHAPATVGDAVHEVGQRVAAIALAKTFNAAWNACDVEAVVACFAEGAVVRHLPAGPPEAQSLSDYWHPDAYDWRTFVADLAQPGQGRRFVSATGRAQVRAWAQEVFARHQRVEAGSYQPAGNRVSWTYRSFVDPYQGRGVEPSEGAVEITVERGKITALTTTITPGSVARREASLSTLADRLAHGPAGSAVARAHPGLDTQARTTPSPAPWAVALVLSLAGAVGLAAIGRPPPRPSM